MAATNHTPLKILMTTDTVGGVWTYTMELCKALEVYNVQIHLVTLGAAMQQDQRNEAATQKHVVIYKTEYKLEWMEEPWKDIDESSGYLLSLAKAIQPDLVHLNCYAYGNLQWNVPVVMIAHSDVFSWWRGVHRDNPPAEWMTYYRRIKAGLNGANTIIAPSKAMATALKTIYHLPKRPNVIYNARTTKQFHQQKKEETIFSAGRIWDEAKNIQLLTKAASKINWPLRIAGESQFDGNLINFNSSNITLLGRLNSSQIAQELSTASIYCLPAKYEPFGLSVLEAALSGCALVLGDIPSLREIWEDSALYINTDDADELADVLNRLTDNDKKREELASKAMARATMYTTEAMAKQYLQVYTEVLQYSNRLIETKISVT